MTHWYIGEPMVFFYEEALKNRNINIIASVLSSQWSLFGIVPTMVLDTMPLNLN